MTEHKEKLISRRQALRRLGLGVATAYITPSLTTLSAAQAKSNPTKPSKSSDPTAPTPPSEPTAPSQPSGAVRDGISTASSPSSAESASCRVKMVDDDSFSISRKDYDAAQVAVRSGNALPLDSVWPQIADQYNGRLIGIEFAGSGTGAQYQFRAISASGRLETIVVRASTGLIETIVGC